MIINNKNIKSSKTIKVFSPYSGELLGEVFESSLDHVSLAVENAHKTFKETSRHLSPYERYNILYKLYKILEDRKDKIAKLITRESGKVIRESLVEVERALNTLLFAAEEAKRIYGEILPCDVTSIKTGKMAYVHRTPVGVIGAITPFNFPLSTIIHKMAPAIASGNTVVVKPSPSTPLTAEALGHAFIDAGWPPGICNIIQGGSEAGEFIAKHSLIRHLTFTGSVSVGHRLTQIAGLKKLTLELGGNDPLIILPDADLVSAVTVCIEQGLGTSGQRCTAVKRVFVHESVMDSFKEMLVKQVKSLKVGDPLEYETYIGPLISEEAAMEIEEKVNDAILAGARRLTDGQRENALYPPVILDKVPEKCRLIQSETFGPVLPLISFKDIDDCIRQVNSTIYGLQAGVFTNSLEISKRLFAELEVGALIVNGGPGFRVDSLPFGGVKESGLGREGVLAAIREMTEEKLFIM